MSNIYKYKNDVIFNNQALLKSFNDFNKNIKNFLSRIISQNEKSEDQKNYIIDVIKKLEFEFTHEIMIFILGNFNIKDVLYELTYIKDKNISYITQYQTYENNIKLSLFDTYNLIKKYEEIIIDIFKNIDIKNLISIFSFEVKNNISLYTILKNQKSLQEKEIIDIYLETYYQCPNSTNKILNYIYFLRRFPLFKKLINFYFISRNNLKQELDLLNESIRYDFFDLFSFNNVNINLINIKNIYEEEYDINNYIYIFDFVNFSEDKLNEIKISLKYHLSEKNLNFFTYQDDNVYISDINKLIVYLEFNKNIKMSEVIFLLWLKYILTTNDQIDSLDINSLNIMYTNLIFNLYNIYINLNLNLIGDVVFLKDIYFLNKTYEDPLNAHNLFFIYLSYFFFIKEEIIQSVENNIKKIKNIFNFFKYFNSQHKDHIDLIFFLSFSNERIKVFKNTTIKNDFYKFMLDLYDKCFNNPEQVYIFNN